MTTERDLTREFLSSLQKLEDSVLEEQGRVKNGLNKEGSSDFTDLVENVLETAFRKGVNHRPSSSDQQRKDFASLIETTVDVIDKVVFGIGLNFDNNRGPRYLILRSGLQFILDNFGSGQREEVKDSLKVLSSSIEEFDKSLQTWKDCNVVTEGDFAYSYDELCKPPYVPDEHDWWWV